MKFNNGDSAISEVEVILDHSHSLFELEGSRIKELGTIPPSIPRTTKLILKSLGCVHTEEIGATVRYRIISRKRASRQNIICGGTIYIKKFDARGAIRTHELLQDWTLNPAPLTWLGNSRTIELMLQKHIVALFVLILYP